MSSSGLTDARIQNGCMILRALLNPWWRLVGWGFTQLYTNFAWAYDAVAWAVSRGHWIQWGHAALPWVKGPRVLEIGSGPGHLLVTMASEGYAVSGIDLSAQMMRIARRRLGRHGVRAGLVRGRAQALPWPDTHFDSVVMTFPAGFALHPQTLSEVWRVLRPGGCLVVVDGARPRGGLYGWLVDVAFRITHESGNGLQAFGNLLEEAGLTVTREVQHWPDSSVEIIIGCKKDQRASLRPIREAR